MRKRAEARGFTGSFELTATPRDVVSDGSDGHLAGARYHLYEVHLEGAPACYENSRLLAALDEINGKWVVRLAAGVHAEVDRSQLVSGWCGHCRTNRPNRSRYYLVERDGERIQVGSTCLKDFVGHDVKPVFLDSKDVLGEGEALERRPAETDTVSAVQAIMAIVRRYGYHPRAAKGATVTYLERVLYGAGEADEQLRMQITKRLPSRNEAQALIESVRSDLASRPSDFGRNLEAVLDGEVVHPKHLGILSAIAVANPKVIDQLKSSAGTRVVRNFTYAGRVGQAITVTGVIDALEAFSPTEERTRILHIISDDHLFATITSAKWVADLNAGDRVTLSGVIGAHRVHLGERQTRLRRPRLAEVHAAS